MCWAVHVDHLLNILIYRMNPERDGVCVFVCRCSNKIVHVLKSMSVTHPFFIQMIFSVGGVGFGNRLVCMC